MSSRLGNEQSLWLTTQFHELAKQLSSHFEYILLIDYQLKLLSVFYPDSSQHQIGEEQIQTLLLKHKTEIENKIKIKRNNDNSNGICRIQVKIFGHTQVLWLLTSPLSVNATQQKAYLAFMGNRKQAPLFGLWQEPDERPLGECFLNTNFEIVQCQSFDKHFHPKNLKGKLFFSLFDAHFSDYILQTLINTVKSKQPSSFRAILGNTENQWVVVKTTPTAENQIHVVLYAIFQHRNTAITSSDLIRSLVDIGTIFSQATNLKQAIDQTLQHIRKILKLHSLTIFQDDPANEQFLSVHSSVYKQQINSPMLNSFPYEISLGFKKILEKNQPIISSSIYAGMPERVVQYLDSLGIKAYAVIPIFIAGKFYGAMIVAHLRTKHWKQDEIEYLLACASILGQNIDRELNRMELVDTRNDFINIFNSASDMVFIINFSGTIIEANQSAINVSGFSYHDLLGQSINSLTTSSYDIEPVMAGEVHQSQQMITGTTLITNDGRHIPIEVRERIIQCRGQKSILIVARDISERKNIDRLILKTILETEERERKRIAETIHDDLAPLLSALKIYLDLFSNKKIESGTEGEIISIMQQIVDQAISTAKNTAIEMMPNLLTHFGMVEAISDFVHKINRTKAIKINLSTYPELISIDPISGRILYGVVKELVNNTLKHGSASIVEIEILKQTERLTISYRENGRGFNFHEKLRSESSGLGLKNIVNKIDSLSGQIVFKRIQNQWFEIKIVIPLNANL